MEIDLQRKAEKVKEERDKEREICNSLEILLKEEDSRFPARQWALEAIFTAYKRSVDLLNEKNVEYILACSEIYKNRPRASLSSVEPKNDSERISEAEPETDNSTEAVQEQTPEFVADSSATEAVQKQATEFAADNSATEVARESFETNLEEKNEPKSDGGHVPYIRCIFCPNSTQKRFMEKPVCFDCSSRRIHLDANGNPSKDFMDLNAWEQCLFCWYSTQDRFHGHPVCFVCQGKRFHVDKHGKPSERFIKAAGKSK